MFLFTLESSDMPEIINGVEVKYDSHEFSSLVFKQRQYKEGSVFGFKAEDIDGGHALWVIPSSEGKAKLIISNADGSNLVDTFDLTFAEMENKVMTVRCLLSMAMYAYFKWSEKLLNGFQGFRK